MGFWQQTVANMILHLFSFNHRIQRLIYIWHHARERKMWDDGNMLVLSLLFGFKAAAFIVIRYIIFSFILGGIFAPVGDVYSKI